MLVALVLLILGGSIWFATRREEKIEIIGNVSAKDLAEIKSIVRAERRRSVFPSFSWQTIVDLPTAAFKELRYRITVIDCYKANTVVVTIGQPPLKPHEVRTMVDSYFLMKTSNGWHI